MTPLDRVDLLVFGPHADDIEIGMGGTVAKHASLGHRIGLCDLTAGEMASNGTVDERLREAELACKALGARWRTNLGWPDRGFSGTATELESAVELIRRTRPATIALPYWSDRHPDHVTASRVLTEAIFNAGLRRYPCEGEPWRPTHTCYYFINDPAPPSYVVDVSEHYDAKRSSLACYHSQFGQQRETVATRLNSPLFGQLVESRDAQFGALAGGPFAEGFVVRQPVLRPHLLDA